MDSLSCERCGAPLPAESRFCPRCGAPVSSVMTEELKVVTVLFADLSGSTELAIRLDPERFREVIGAFFRMVSAELESLRGRAEKYIGDAVMAVFGIPHAHEDDALRAVRASLIIRDRAARLAEELGLAEPLQVHVGITSGAVATGSSPADQLLVSGPAVSLAARLQEAAHTGEILVDATTKALTRQSVAFGEPRVVEPKGFDGEVTSWPVEALSARSSRRTIPLVNRRRELALLTDTFERVRESSRAHLITVLGEPGIGKSRLVEEFAAGLDESVRVLRGRANPFDGDATFAPLAEMIRRELGVGDEAGEEELQGRLHEVIEGCCDPTDVEQVVARLGLALGLGEETPEGHRYRSAEIRSGFLAFLRGLTRRGAAVLIFEDLSSAGAALLELVEDVVRQARRLPVLVVAVARDWMLEVRPGWAGGLPDAVTLRLEPLATADATELVLVAGESIDHESAERIAVQTGGNPFFIIETTGMLLHEDLQHAASPMRRPLVPPTVQAVVASRIDHLDEPAKELLRVASVFAKPSFHESELTLVAGPDTELLDTLEDEEVLVRDQDRPGVWRFRHELLRAVAYDTLPKRERLRLHVQIADGLAEDGDVAKANVATVAYHLEKAAKASLDLNPGDRSLAERAVEALRRAGHIARRRMESRRAIDLYQRALSLAGPKESWGQREAEILAEMGEARYWLAEFEEAEASLSRALEVGRDHAWTRAYASRFLGDIALNARGDVQTASRLFDEALAAAREIGDQWALARTLLMAGWAPYWRGDLEEVRVMFQEALDIARGNPERDLWAEARALVSLSSVISPTDDVLECVGLEQRALEIGRDMNDPFTVAVASQHLGNSFRRMARFDEALAHSDEAVRIFRELDARWELASALGDRGEIHRLAARYGEAEPDLTASLELCRKLRERSLLTWTVAELALVLLLRGDVGAARETLEEPTIHLQGDPGSELALRVGALVDLADGDRAGALERAQRALELTRGEGWPNPLAWAINWTGTIFGADAVGGERALQEARHRLESMHWIAALQDHGMLGFQADAGEERTEAGTISRPGI